MLRKLCLLATLSAVLPGYSAMAGTFGKVVSIGGHASDVALDEPRKVLYVANFTANRIDVMSLTTKTIQTSLNVIAQQGTSNPTREDGSSVHRAIHMRRTRPLPTQLVVRWPLRGPVVAPSRKGDHIPTLGRRGEALEPAERLARSLLRHSARNFRAGR